MAKYRACLNVTAGGVFVQGVQLKSGPSTKP